MVFHHAPFACQKMSCKSYHSYGDGAFNEFDQEKQPFTDQGNFQKRNSVWWMEKNVVTGTGARISITISKVLIVWLY